MDWALPLGSWTCIVLQQVGGEGEGGGAGARLRERIGIRERLGLGGGKRGGRCAQDFDVRQEEGREGKACRGG